MNNYVSLLALNAARLLLIPDYIYPQHNVLACDIVKDLTTPETLDKRKLEWLFQKACQLVARDMNGRRAILTAREELEYLISLEE